MVLQSRFQLCLRYILTVKIKVDISSNISRNFNSLPSNLAFKRTFKNGLSSAPEFLLIKSLSCVSPSAFNCCFRCSTICWLKKGFRGRNFLINVYNMTVRRYVRVIWCARKWFRLACGDFKYTTHWQGAFRGGISLSTLQHISHKLISNKATEARNHVLCPRFPTGLSISQPIVRRFIFYTADD